MMTMNDQLVVDYLANLRAATVDLPPGEREELVSNIAEHITTSLAEIAEPTESDVRTILDRLGDPASIAAEARGQSAPPSWATAGSTAAPARPAPGVLEWGGVVTLGVGSYLVPVIGTVAGLVMVSLSQWWTTSQKVVAAALSLSGAIALPLLLAGFWISGSTTVEHTGTPGPVVQYGMALAELGPAESSPGGPSIDVVFALLLAFGGLAVTGPLLAAVILAVQLNHRSRGQGHS